MRPKGAEGDVWQDGAEILGPPADLETEGLLGLSNGWPARWTVVHWMAELDGLPGGEYELRCRGIDRNGIAQPMPRPFAKGGRSEIQTLPLLVE